MDKILVVGINGSPHKNGTTSVMLKKFLSAVEKHGGKTKLINLIDYDIKPCLGCYSTNPKSCKYPCVQKDDAQKLHPLLIKADAIVFGTPIYWFNMSGLMKNFIDRLCCLAAGGYLLEGKVGIFFAVSKENEGGRVNATLSMASALNHLGLLIPPYSTLFYPGKEEIVRNGKVVWSDWVSEDTLKIGKNIIQLCKFLKKSKFKW
jgi:multimeric flavodoxin WrbA